MDALGWIEVCLLLVALAFLTVFGVIFLRFDVAMHRNVKWLIGSVVINYYLYIVFRMLQIIDQEFVNFAAWLQTLIQIGFTLCVAATTVDSATFIVERAIASVFLKSYEQWRSSVIWITIAVEVCNQCL
jgi:hypothetical protein